MKLPAIESGIPADVYWTLTLDELFNQVEANHNRNLANLKQQAHMDYRMAQSMVYAFNDPSKMPSFEEQYAFAKEELSEEEQIARQQEQERNLLLQKFMNVQATRQRKNLNE